MSVIGINPNKKTFISKIRHYFSNAKDNIVAVFTGVVKYINELFGKFSSLFWLVVAVLAVGLFSPAISFALGLYLIFIVSYIGIFFLIWNVMSDIFYSPAIA